MVAEKTKELLTKIKIPKSQTQKRKRKKEKEFWYTELGWYSSLNLKIVVEI